MRGLALVALLLAGACVAPAPLPPTVQYGPGEGAVLADAVAIRGIVGEPGRNNSAAETALGHAEADWLSAHYPGWAVVGRTAGVDGMLAYHAVKIGKGGAVRTVYFDVSEYMWSVVPV